MSLVEYRNRRCLIQQVPWLSYFPYSTVNTEKGNYCHVKGGGDTGKSIDFERHVTAPEIWLVLTVGVDPRGYFLGGFNLFRLANKKLFGFFVRII